MADVEPLTADAVAKLKVGDLRAQLTKRALPTAGAKAVLVARLLQAVEAEQEVAAATDPAPSATPQALPAATAPAASAGPGSNSPAVAAGAAQEKEHTSENIPEAQATNGAPVGLAPKLQDLSKLSEEERKKLRAQRFKANLEEEKLKLRAQRFNVPYAPLEDEKKAARKARFGIVTDEERLAARRQKFGVLTEEQKVAEEEEKKRKRAQRFGGSGAGPATGGGTVGLDDASKLAERAKRFGLGKPAIPAPMDEEARKKARLLKFGVKKS